MKELGEALKTIFDKLGVFLDLFDLSFFISGATAAGAIGFLCWQWNLRPNIPLPGWMGVTIIILVCYIVGMLCFSAGRWIRQLLTKSARADFRGNQLKVLLTLHGLEDIEPIKSYLKRPPATETVALVSPDWALYNRVWAEIRQNPNLAPSLTLLNRYWVMAATYDGLAVALTVWGSVLAKLVHDSGGSVCWVKTATIFLACFACAAFCSREASRYTLHQLGELAATLASEIAKTPLPKQEQPPY